jgi:hypothetical protein
MSLEGLKQTELTSAGEELSILLTHFVIINGALSQ